MNVKRLLVASLIFIQFSTLITYVHASVTIQAAIDQNIQVVFNFEKINSTTYADIKQNKPSLDHSTIPQTIMENLKRRNLTHVEYYDSHLVFDDSDRSIRATFYLSGSDVLNVTFDKATMMRVYHARTGWRRFHINLTDDFSLNLTEYFGIPVARWQKINYTISENRVHPAYSFNFTGPSSFDPLCYFILPETATNIRAIEDTIIFEVRLSFVDTLLNSPFLVLGAIMAVNIAVLIYRRVRK